MNQHSPNLASPSDKAPVIERVRHELKRRSLTVTATEHVTPQMLRITLTGEDLADFVSAAPDDHVKIFIPTSGQVERRDYTPRRYDNATCTLVLDFALHEAGPATKWALEAQPGSVLDIGGPRGSAVVSGVGKWLLIGDETALPAIGRRIEEAEAGTSITAIAAVTGPEEEQSFETRANLKMLWAHRAATRVTDPAPFFDLIDTLPLEPETFVWIAAEASVARAVRTHLVERRGLPLSWLKAAGYWSLGKADVHEKIGD
jgi:NADPH-dependent ferric siderophore reductase